MRKNLIRWNAGSLILAFLVVAVSGGYWYWNTQHQEISNLQQQIDQLPEGKDKLALVKDRIVLNNTINGSLVQAAGGVLLFVTAYVSWQNLKATQRNVLVAEEKQVTERFTQAINQLGNEGNITVRLGGIYALERISKDSPKDHWTIMEVLTSFIQEKSPLPKSAKPMEQQSAGTENPSEVEEQLPEKVTKDVQAALTVIGRRDAKNDPKKTNRKIDLSRTFLVKANLIAANLSGADLSGATLSGGADLSEANLSGATLIVADLSRSCLIAADLTRTNFSGADLTRATLSGADLTLANLSGADLIETDLTLADLSKANLVGANFRGAKGLNSGQVKAAKNWEDAYYDENFCQQLGLPPQSKRNRKH